MPPQVQTSGPVVTQSPAKIEEPKSNEIKPQEQKQEAPKQDPETAAKNAQAAKQLAKDVIHEDTSRVQIIRNQIAQKLPEKKAPVNVETKQNGTSQVSQTAKDQLADAIAKGTDGPKILVDNAPVQAGPTKPKYTRPVVKEVPIDKALDLMERGEAIVTDATSKGHQVLWEGSVPGKTKAPASYLTEGEFGGKSRIRIDLDQMTPDQLNRYKSLVQAEEAAKSGAAKGAAASVKAPQHTKQGMGVADRSRPTVSDSMENSTGPAEKAAQNEARVTKKGMGVGEKANSGQPSTVDPHAKTQPPQVDPYAKTQPPSVDPHGKTQVGAQKAASVAEKEASAAGKAAASSAAKKGTAAGEALSATEKRAAALAATHVAEGSAALKVTSTGSKIAQGVAHMAPVADAIFMEFNYFASYAEAHNIIRERNTEKGFAVGMAASLMGSPAKDFGLNSIDRGVVTQVLGAEGIAEKSHNKGVYDGYKYAQSLSNEERNKLRESAFKDLSAKGYHTLNTNSFDKTDVIYTAGAMLPGVQKLFSETRKAAELEALRNRKEKNPSYGSKM